EGEIKKTSPPTEINNGDVISQRAPDIQKQPSTPHRVCLHPWWPRQLHQRKEQQPNSLPIPTVSNQASLPMIREVNISFVIALMSVMLQMVNSKAHRARPEVW